MQKIFIVMLMYNIDNFFKTSGSLWKYYRDEMNDDANENIADGYNISNIKITKSRAGSVMVKNCIISEISRAAPVAANLTVVSPTPAEPETSTTGATFQLNRTKHYVSVSTLFINV